MTEFGLTTEELERRGALWTAREIAQQPKMWRQVAALSAIEETRQLVESLLTRRDLQIVLTGAGTSALIGECLAPGIVRTRSTGAQAVSTTDLATGPRTWLSGAAPTLLVSFARSGNSPESVAAVELAGRHASECHHLIFTCNGEGALFQLSKRLPRATALLLPPETNDRGFAMTSSFSCMLLAAARVFGLLPGQAAMQAAAAVDRWWPQCTPHLRALALERFERVVYVGANELKGLAREAALKLLELSDGRVPTMAETPLGLRHGPKTFVNGRTLVIALISNDPYTRRYELDLLEELRTDAIAGRVLALTTDTELAAQHADNVLAPGCAQLTDLGSCLPFAVFAQSLALLQSLALGLRPDTPNAAGVVNRVVRGVKIYPLEG